MDALFYTATDIDINSSLFPLLDFRGTQKSRDRNPIRGAVIDCFINPYFANESMLHTALIHH